MSAPNPQTYAGQRLGLPQDGPGSVASWGRRIGALVIDWFASLLVAGAAVGRDVAGAGGWQSWVPLLVFLLETTLFLTVSGASFGQLVTRVVVVRLDGTPITLLRSLVRAVLVCLVVPPLVFNRDQRGLHDLAAGTVALRR